MAGQLERWDPDDRNWHNIEYIYDAKSGRFIEGKTADPGDRFYHYTPVTENNPTKVGDVYWNTRTGDIYYKDNGKYVLLKDYGKNDVDKPIGGFWGYASDDQLDKVATHIQTAKNQTASQNAQATATSQATANSQKATGVDSYTVQTPSEVEAVANQQTQEDNTQKQKEANAQLHALLANDSVGYSAPQVPKEDTVYYKYGDNEIDLKYYLHNLSTNLQSYLSSKHWSQAQKDAFMHSYEQYKAGLQEQLTTKNNRFSTNDSGILIDSHGILDGKDDHVIIDKNGDTYDNLDQVDSKKLKRSTIEFSPNDEVANYFNTVGSAIVSSGKTRQSEETSGSITFDLNKDGFSSYWAAKVNPGGGQIDIDPYLALDPPGTDGKRSTQNRTKYLLAQLQDYATKIQQGNYNFTDTPFKDKNEYLRRIQEAITNLSNGWDASDAISLQAIGITPDFYKAFMTDQGTPNLPKEQAEADKTQQENEQLAKSMDNFIDQVEANWNKYKGDKNTFTPGKELAYTPNSLYGTNANAVQNIVTKLRAWGYSVNASSTNNKEALAAAIDSLSTQAIAAIKKGNKVVYREKQAIPLNQVLQILIPAWLDQGLLVPESQGSNTYIYNDPDEDATRGAILCFSNNKLYYDYLENHKTSQAWQNLKAKFVADYSKSQNSSGISHKHSFDKEGGILQKFQEGGDISFTSSEEEMEPEDTESTASSVDESTGVQSDLEKLKASVQQIKTSQYSNWAKPGMSLGEAFVQALYGEREAAAKAKGMSYERYNAKQRSFTSAPTVYNPDNGILKTEDYVRLGAIATDIVSLVLDPVSGAVANVGSTAANFLADWADDTVTTSEMWKNLGANLGMDALSIIPIVGDAAGTGGKLLKSVKNIAPKLIKALTTYGVLATLKNGANIAESLSKITSDEKLTVGDWQNIAQAITALAGVNGAVKGGVAKQKAKSRARVEDAVGLNLKKVDANGKVLSTQDYILKGEHAKEIKALGNDEAAINAKLKEIEGFGDGYQVNTHVKSVPLEGHIPFGRKTNANGEKTWGFKSPVTVKKQVDVFDIYDPNLLNKYSWTGATALNTNRQNAVLADNIVNAKTKTEVDALKDTQLKAITEAAEKATAKRKQLIADTEAAIKGTTDENGNVLTKGLETEVNEATTKNQSAKDAYDTNIQEQLATSQEILDLQKGGYDKSSVKIGNREYYSENAPKATQDLKNRVDTLKKRVADTDDLIQKAHDLESLKTKKSPTKKERAKVVALESELKGKSSTDLEKSKKRAQKELDKLEDYRQKRAEFQAKMDKQDHLHDLESNLWDQMALSNSELATLQMELASKQRGLAKLADPNVKTSATQELLNKYTRINPNTSQIEYLPMEVSWGTGSKEKRVITDTKDILERLNLMRKGGRLQFLKTGNQIAGVGLNSPNTWYDQIFSNYMQTILDRIAANKDYYKELNDHQTAHYNLYTAANASGDWKKHAYAPSDNSVKTYQEWYDGQEFNEKGIKPNYESRYNFDGSKRYSKDSPSGNWQKDNYFSSITDDRRVLGRKGDWTEDQLTNFNEALKAHGLEMHLGNGDYYYINPIGEPNISSSAKEPGLLEARAGGENEEGHNSRDILAQINDKLKKAKNYLPDPMEYLRYKMLERDNRRIAENAIAGEKPYYQDPLVDYTLVRSSLEDEAEGQHTAADYMRHGQHAVTSDKDKQLAYSKELLQNAMKAIKEGLVTSTAMYRKTQEADQVQRAANHKSEHDIAAQNRVAGMQTEKNKNSIWGSLLAQNATAKNNFMLAWENKINTQKAKDKALQEKADLAALDNNIKADPNRYGANLSNAELSAWNKQQSGSTDFSDSERTALASALSKISNTYNTQMYQYYGINPMATISSATQFTPTLTEAGSFESSNTPSTEVLQVAKDGSKLDIAKLRIRAKNADRLAKNIEKTMDNLEKKMSRISKRMYGLPEVKMIK